MDSEGHLINNGVEEKKSLGWKGFAYVGQSRQLEEDDFKEELLTKKFSINEDGQALAKSKVGDRVAIVALNCGEANSRLMGMGLIPGATLEVISCTKTGSVIVALLDNRLGLGAEIAEKIGVVNLKSQSGTKVENLSTQKITTMTTNTDNTAIKLRDGAIGSTLKVIGYEPTARDYKRKLLAMGLTPGTEIIIKRHAPLGDPTEIEVRGFHLSLRKVEADALIVEPVKEV